MNKLREECGVFGIFAPGHCEVAATTYYGLFALQHRGQSSCGIVVNDDGLFRTHKDSGLVNDVFTPEVLASIEGGNMALGHCRYGTSGSKGRENAQPIVVDHIKGRMAIAHNGSLINSFELREELELKGSIFHTQSDIEVMSYIIIEERLRQPSIEQAINAAMHRVKGAYSLVVMSPSKMIACRDENGFRPLCYGVRDDGAYIIASESCALGAVGAKFVRDLKPGEILVFTKDGVESIEEHCGKACPKLCVFEYVYFARPDSVIDGCCVHEARVRAGRYLAQEHPVEADVVVGVPDSGLDAALGYSRESGIPYAPGLLKNRYIGRTFISPGQKSRENLVRMKLSPIASVIAGKRVVLVDDSIVRGTTCGQIVNLLRAAGAKEVHMRISSPPFKFPCYYGTDISSKDKLIANKYPLEEIAGVIGVDSLGYLSVENAMKLSGETKEYCNACFTGEYPTETPKENRGKRFDQKISEKEKNS
ncbi:MAG: amidophosphoribosyltransferase [Ruminococcaceae bacterium]|nr:amidophosphoribosyltransferase [Oscillospiraceae bacterium]